MAPSLAQFFVYLVVMIETIISILIICSFLTLLFYSVKKAQVQISLIKMDKDIYFIKKFLYIGMPFFVLIPKDQANSVAAKNIKKYRMLVILSLGVFYVLFYLLFKYSSTQ